MHMTYTNRYNQSLHTKVEIGILEISAVIFPPGTLVIPLIPASYVVEYLILRTFRRIKGKMSLDGIKKLNWH